MMICFSIGFVFCYILRMYLVLENKRRDREAHIGEGDLAEDAGQLNLADKSDKEMETFRYVY